MPYIRLLDRRVVKGFVIEPNPAISPIELMVTITLWMRWYVHRTCTYDAIKQRDLKMEKQRQIVIEFLQRNPKTVAVH